MTLGAHVSISGGLDKAISRGESIGATAIQTFASSPRSLKFIPHSEEVIKAYLAAKAQSSVKDHVFHAVYLVNLASEKPDYVEASKESLISYQTLAGKIGAIGTIFHVGSHKGAGFDTVKESVAQAISEVVTASPDKTMLLLENAAGHAGTIGQTVDELAFLVNAAIRKGADETKIGVCLDTQHAFVSGVDGRDLQKLNQFIDEVDEKIGIDKVKVIHVNDSKYEFNAHRDRHENIGSGYLGNEGIANWLNHPQFKSLPFILEVPGKNSGGPGSEDIADLRALLA